MENPAEAFFIACCFFAKENIILELQPQESNSSSSGRGLRFLLPRHIEMIDEALDSIGDYGEIRLVVEKGQLRFVVTQLSFDALKWRSGSIENRSKDHSNP